MTQQNVQRSSTLRQHSNGFSGLMSQTSARYLTVRWSRRTSLDKKQLENPTKLPPLLTKDTQSLSRFVPYFTQEHVIDKTINQFYLPVDTSQTSCVLRKSTESSKPNIQYFHSRQWFKINIGEENPYAIKRASTVLCIPLVIFDQ